MKLFALLLSSVSIAFMACDPGTQAENQNDQKTTLDSLMQYFHEETLKLDPLSATYAGDNRYNDQLPIDISEAYRQKTKAFYTDVMNQLSVINRESLLVNDQISYDVLQWECNNKLNSLNFHSHLMPVNQMQSVPILMGILASGKSAQPFKTVKDYDNWLSRLHAYVVWCDMAITNMKEGMVSGYVLPKVLAEKTITQLAAFDHGPVEDHLFYSPVKLMPDDFSSEEKERLTNAYAQTVDQKIIPAYKRMVEFMHTKYLPACRETSGIATIPDGEAYYKYLVKQFTTTDKPASEIFELGQQEVARITQEMEAVKQQVGFTGDLKEFFNYVRNKKELMPYTSAEQVIAHFNEIHKTMLPYLNKMFSKVPKTPFEVRRTEAFREATASPQYNSGSFDGSRPGIFYVPVPDATKYNIHMDEDIFLHEAIPGHHYQVSLQRENEALPAFRRINGYSAYGEGWGLYAESLGKELGLYTDPYQYFGMLSGEIFRAIRLVVDVGLHTKGWTREEAIQYTMDHSSLSESFITSEIERYMAIPAQALSYKTGQLKIQELRRKAEQELGESFDIAEFHNQVLETGSIPLNILEEKINRWIVAKKEAEVTASIF